MSLVIRFSPPSLTAEQYDSAIRRLTEDGVFPADGLDYEICFGSPGNLKVSQVWDSQEQLDAFGARLAACAGFDPAAALRLLGRLRTLAAEPPALGGYFSSHPAPEERIRRLGQMLRTR